MTHTTRQQAYLQAMGIQAWVSRAPQAVPAEETAVISGASTPLEQAVNDPPVAAPVDMVLPPKDIANLDWDALRVRVEGCTACDLHQTRTQTVFGVGNPQADWMVIGEAPGADEDRQGEPFVGRAGKLLNNMLKAVGLAREEVYIANILKCRPPNNRDPHQDEIAHCEAYLQRQVALVQPKVILAVGRISAHNLLKCTDSLSKLRGKVHYYGQTPVVVTYHPAYLLRTLRDKAKAWQDLQFAIKVSRGELG